MKGKAGCDANENEEDWTEDFCQQQDGSSQCGQQKEGGACHVFSQSDGGGGDERQNGRAQALKGGIDPPVVPLVLKIHGDQQEADKGRHGNRKGSEQGNGASGKAQSGEDCKIDNDDARDGLGNGIGFGYFGWGEPVAAVDQFGLENWKGRHAASKGTGANAEVAPKDGWKGWTHHGSEPIREDRSLQTGRGRAGSGDFRNGKLTMYYNN